MGRGDGMIKLCNAWECTWHNPTVAECDKQDIHIHNGECEDYDAVSDDEYDEYYAKHRE